MDNITFRNISIYADTQQSIGGYIVTVNDNAGGSPLFCDGLYFYDIRFYGEVPYEILTLATDYDYLANCTNVIIDGLIVDDFVSNISTLYGITFNNMINLSIYNSYIGNFTVGSEQSFECYSCQNLYFEDNIFEIDGTWNLVNSNFNPLSYNNTGYFPDNVNGSILSPAPTSSGL